MRYDLVFRYDEVINYGFSSDCFDPPDSLVQATISYQSLKVVNDNDGVEMPLTFVGLIRYIYYNQALAMAYGRKISEVSCLNYSGSGALMELDYALMSQDTIREIGQASNPNFMVLEDLGVTAYWRKKGLSQEIFKTFIRQMRGKCGYIVILDPKPLQNGDCMESLYKHYGVDLTGLERNPETAQQKLNAFFRRCGFRLFKNYPNVYICNVEQAIVTSTTPLSRNLK